MRLPWLPARFGRLFVGAEPREQAGRYLEGLLGPVERKNGWQLAEAIGDVGKISRGNTTPTPLASRTTPSSACSAGLPDQPARR
jgi:hypothetical protein